MLGCTPARGPRSPQYKLARLPDTSLQPSRLRQYSCKGPRDASGTLSHVMAVAISVPPPSFAHGL